MSGEFVIEKALSGRNSIKIILLANDVAQATQLKYQKLAESNKKLLRYTDLSKEEMANSIGKSDRAAVAICDEGFKKAILKILDSEIN